MTEHIVKTIKISLSNAATVEFGTPNIYHNSSQYWLKVI